MKKLILGLLMLFAFTYSFSQFEGTWKMAPQAAALGVGPSQGSMVYWSNSLADVTTRACFFDDQYVFNADGSFNNVMDGSTWVEGWQGVSPDQCSTPVFPHDGSNAATWAYDSGLGTLTLTGTGAFMGIPKAANGFELTSPSQAPASITYLVTVINSASMTLDIAVGGNWWRFLLEKQAAAGSDASLSDLQVDGSTISGFLSNIVDYNYGLPEGTIVIPSITSATPTDPGASSVVITQATSIPGDATVVVTAADGVTTLTYTVSFAITIPNSTPPIPPQAQADVISIYSDAYTNISGTNFNPWWGQATSVTVDDVIAGNNTLRYENLNYQGTEYTVQNVASYGFLHLDYWTTSTSTLQFSLISIGPLETPYVLPAATGTWGSVDIPLSYYVPPVNLGNVFQFKLEGIPSGANVWLDNMYFWKSAGTGILTFNPQDGETNVAVDVNPTLSFTVPVTNADGSAITNADIPSFITFKETDVNGADVPFSGTINASKDLITIIPSSNLGANQTYYLALNDASIRWLGGDLIAGQSSTFSTVSTPLSLPVTFDDPLVNYSLADFGGTNSTIIVDPSNPSNNVVETVKNIASEDWAGTTVGEPTGLTPAVPFAAGSTVMSIRVFSPQAGIPVLFKLEVAQSTPIIAVETTSNTTVANAWETIYFDFSNENPGTPPLDLANSYNKPVVFFNFGTVGTGETYYWDDITFVGAPPASLTFDPPNGATNIPISIHPTLTFSAPVQMANGNPITNSDIPSLIGLKETDAFGTPIPFTGTIDANKQVITVIPNSVLLNNQQYYLALNNLVIKYQGGNLIPAQSSQFTTIHQIQYDLYDNFDDQSTLTWGYWDNHVGGVLDVGAANPSPSPFGLNPSPNSAKLTKVASSDPYTHAFAILGGKLDLSLNNQFKMFVYSDVAGSVFSLKLQNNDLAAPWTTEVFVDYTTQNANTWELATYDFSPYSDRTDLDKLVVMINAGQSGPAVYYFDEIYGTPFTPPAPSPVLVNSYTAADGLSIEVQFDKDMEAEPGNPENFIVTVDGTPNLVTSTLRKVADNTIIVLNLTSAVEPGDVILLSYLMSGTITSLDHGVLQPFVDYNVTNTLVTLIDLKVFLEGPFNGFNMNTTLNPSFLPLGQPYNTSPWNYSGLENVATIPNNNVVDWVLIELRDAPSAALATSGTMVSRQAAFLLRNGNVVSLDGSSQLLFDVNILDSMFVVVWHRNHLGVLSSVALQRADGVYSYDFSTGANKAYSGNLKEIGVGIWGMYGGNGLGDMQIDDLDKTSVWEVEAGNSGYQAGDYNMDGQVDNFDKDEVWLLNKGTLADLYQLIWQDEFDVDGAPDSDN